MEETKSGEKNCQNFYPDLVTVTLPDRRKLLSIRKYGWRLKRSFWHLRVLGPEAVIKSYYIRKFQPQTLKKGRKTQLIKPIKNSEFKEGEIVEILPEKEIFSTLDKNGKHRGLAFTQEMSKYCGKKFKIIKKINKIISESTGELRSMKNPTYILEGVVCDGKAHGDCDRLCFCYWREQWLKKPEK